MNKEVYLSNLEWTKTHDDIGGVSANMIFKDNLSYDEYNKLLKSGYFILCDKDCITNLQEENKRLNNIIKEFDKWLLGEQMMFYKSSDGERLIRYGETKNKWIKLKGEDNE